MSQPPQYQPGPQPQVIIMPQMPGGGGQAMTITPQMMTCPYCGAQIQTAVQYQTGTMTHVAALIICVVGGCVLCLCLIPYCVDTCKDVIHTCPNCGQQVGYVKRM